MKDRFSKHAAGYAAFRPTYPTQLYEFILQQINEKITAWDCGTGNGQVALDLAPHFNQVLATDISISQIRKAEKIKNVSYSICPADNTSFPSSGIDLITVGQAIHWFDIPAFYKEVNRVAKSKAVVAVWGYGLLSIGPEIDALITDFYVNVVGPYWDPERRLIDDRYSSIPFPFEEVPVPKFSFSFLWSMEQLFGYLTTWSSVQKFINVHDTNPVHKLMESLRPMWKNERQLVTFPLFLRCGRILK